MTTGNFTDLERQHDRPRPHLPFVGWEVPWSSSAFVFWLGWHYLQIRMENRQLDDEARELRKADNLQKALQSERPPN